MDTTLYTATSGLILEERRLELIANNLANANTPGFQPERLIGAAVGRGVRGGAAASVQTSVAVAGTWRAPGPGPVRATGRELDVALPDGVYLAVQTAAGTRYTRAGALQVSPEGALVDALGAPVLDRRGRPIRGLGPGSAITPEGAVRSGEGEVAQLGLYRARASELRAEGAGRFAAAAAPAEASDARLMVGWLEGSNTQPVGELIRMIEAQRAFESYQRVVNLNMNEVNRKAVNDLAG